ncbi:extracellular calcium-sensing receptor-like [Pleurodeles waltl]|uniref:extracellular calcium-sensing receptor-like n=1 Tax=Pleurodeles waltl TaxID=8319 RepID=UPI003709C251
MGWSALLTLGLVAMSLPPCCSAGCSLDNPEETGHELGGDVLIGGIIPVHWNWKDPETTFTAAPTPILCRDFSIRSYHWARAIDFAVDEINQDTTFLPNVTLGVRIFDSCLSLTRSLRGVTWLLAGDDQGLPNYRYPDKPPLAVIIADSGTTKSIAIGRWLGLHRYPQISYFASSTVLSDKVQFPSFFRTIPSDDFQARGLAQLVVQFGWTWVGLLSTDNDYGQLGSQILKAELSKFGVCIAFHRTIPLIAQDKKINRIVEEIQRSTATAILVFSSDPYICPIMEKLSKMKGTRKVWLASEGWSTSPIVSTVELADMLSGTIGFAIHEGEMPGFTDFLLQIHPLSYPRDPFLKLFWAHAFKCQWPDTVVTVESGLNKTPKAICSGHENPMAIRDLLVTDSDLRISYNIYNAVYAVAHTLRNIWSCVPGQGPFRNNTCANIGNVKPWEILHYLKSVTFKNKLGEEMFFDRNGDPPAVYDIVNWQSSQEGTIQYVKVGSFNNRAPKGQEMFVNFSTIKWNMQGNEIPLSVCSESCVPGYRKAARKGQAPCCFDCIQCSEGEISNEKDATECQKCPSDQWSNDKRDTCVPKQTEFLSYHTLLGIVLVLVGINCSLKTLSILLIFIKFADTPVVKANNRVLTYILLVALMLSFLCSLFFIGKPHKITCVLRQPAFGVIFAVCISCVLAKTIMVVIAFNATKPGSNLRKWLGLRVPIFTVSGCTLGQFIICASWLLLCPPFPDNNMKLKTGTIVVQCNECSETAFWCMLSYMGMLAGGSFVLAFLSRNLPDTFNEAKWITFSMLVFLSVWMSFIPGYLSTQGKYTTAMEVFAIISSSAGILICIFIPKCFIILFKPEMNTRDHLLRKGNTQTKE